MRAALVALLLIGCSHVALRTVVPATVDVTASAEAAKQVSHDVLVERFGGVTDGEDDGQVSSRLQCRTRAGDPCATVALDNPRQPLGSNDATFHFFVVATIEDNGTGATVRVAVRPPTGDGDSIVPATVQSEVDATAKAIDAKLH